MLDFLTDLFDTSGFPPRWHCGSWSESLGWLHILSDLAICSAYFTIPVILVYFVLRRRDVPFRGVFWLFGAFILACGTTHLMEAIIFWHPLYRLAGVIKLFTAIVSWGTVIALVPIVPKALAMRSPAQLEREITERTAELTTLNESLEAEVRDRQRAEEEITRLNRELQSRADELQTILDIIPIGVAIAHDPQCLRITHNPYFSELLGVAAWDNASLTAPPDERPTNFTNYRDGKEVPTAELPMQVACTGVEVRDVELDLVCRGRDPRKLLYHARPLFDRQGKVRGSVGAALDITGRKQAEEALRQATDQLRIVTESMAAVVIRCSRDLNYLWVSKHCANWLARPIETIIGRPIIEIVGEQAFEQLRPHIEQVLAGQTVRYEQQVHYQGIGPRWINAVYTPTRDARGVPDGWVSIVIDIDDRKRMEEALRVSEERLAAELEAMTRLHALSTRLMACSDLRSALEDVLDGAIHTTHADFGNIQLYNPESRALEIVVHRGFRQDFLDYFRAVRVDEGAVCAQAMKSGERIIIEDVQLDPTFEPHRPIAAAADYRAVQSTPLMNRSGRVLGMLSTHFRQPHRVSERDERLLDLYARHAADFLERLRVEEAVQESEQRFARFMQHLPGLAWIKDVQGRYVYANDAAEKAFGTARANLYGKTDEDVFPPETARQFKTNDRQAIASEAGVQVIETLEHDDGIKHSSLVSKFPILGPGGQVTLVGGMAIDITDRLRVEEALKDADRRKDEFLATLAHELRNPLAPIRNALDLMKRGDGNHTLIEQSRALMERQVRQMVRLIDDLLDLSRISRGKVQLRKERVELAVVVQSAVEASRPLMEAQSHELTVTLPHKPIYLDADQARLSQIISNLLNNAAKYTEKDGHIWLTAEQQGDEAVVSVRDTGIGIAAEHLPHLFEMFSQVAPALERSQGGLGVGLALVRGLVELHGGTIEARSGGIGRGSEFVVRLPVLDAPVQEAQPESVKSNEKPRSGPTYRILVVDDNRDAAESLTMVLRLIGHDIQTAHDGVEAVQAAATFRPDVALMDIGMPKMNGYEAARHIREQAWGRRIVLVALTGWGHDEDKRRASEAGFHYHLTKPVEPAALEKLLEGLTQPKN
jgi:PAS domain S-box-containing protein